MTRAGSSKPKPLVSVITCVRNSEEWIEECLDSISKQTYDGPIEVSIYNDGSSDRSEALIFEWHKKMKDGMRPDVTLVISSNTNTECPKGVGYGKNRAIEQSSGEFLCFLDSDDIMHEDRIQMQMSALEGTENVIVGTQIRRIPENSTPRYVNWANNLSPSELNLQIYTCFGPSVLMPTWFCSRATYERVEGGFVEDKPTGVPEDLLFFHAHMRLGGTVARVDRVLLTYRYHEGNTSHSVTDETIWTVRLLELERNVLPQWGSFIIWNAGKEGRRLYRCLQEKNRRKVTAFADVDPKKVNRVYTYEEFDGPKKPKVPIIHFSELKRGNHIVICVKLGLTKGQFEQNLQHLDLREGIDYVHFG